MADNEWELSKENVQPIKQGRRMSSLNAGLRGNDEHRIREEKHVFETELRTYAGDDPIEVWYKYILWAEQTFPKGGSESVLTKLLERCARQFNTDERYKNDERYIYVWMKMADICNDPLEIYKFMYDQSFGCELGCFYEGWACLLEQLGNYKKADAVFQNGLQKNAQPYEQLKAKHEQFQSRVARRVASGAEIGAEEAQAEAAAPHRQVLSQLRTLGKKKQAPVSRVGSAIQGSAGVLSGARSKGSSKTSNTGIQIFCDENQPPALPPQTAQYGTAPTREVANKENEKKAGTWGKQKMGKQTVSVPISEVSSYKQLPFAVHVDEDNQNIRTPAKVPDCGKQVLSCRKEDSRSTSQYLQSMSSGLGTGEGPKERPMYCKDKLFCGVEEFSLEELRGMAWKRRQDRLLQKQEDDRVRELRENLEAERRQLQDEAERVRQQRLALQQEEQALYNETKRKRLEMQQQLQKDRELELQRHQQALSDSIEQRMQEQQIRQQQVPHTTGRTSSSRHLVFEDGSHGNTENIQPSILPQQLSASKRPFQGSGSQLGVRDTLQPPGETEFMGTSRTSNSFSNTSHPLSGESFNKTLSGPPSPTVNMKEAMQVVMGMFNGSLELNDTNMAASLQPPPAQQVPPVSSGLPFQIYEENQPQAPPPPSQTHPQPPPQIPLPYAIYQDKETRSLSSHGSVSLRKLRTSESSSSGQESSHRGLSVTGGLFDDDIEFHQRDDITLAPLGSHQSFAEAARFVSTPFNPNSSASGARKTPNLDESEMEVHEDDALSNMSGIEFHPDPQTAPPLGQVPPPAPGSDVQNTTAENTTSNSFKQNNLSPIMEGSSEDSGASSRQGTLHYSSHSLHHKVTLTPVPDQTENTSMLLAASDGNNESVHQIDVSTYVPPDMDERTEHLLSMSVCIVDSKDPFDRKALEMMLNRLTTPLHHYENYNSMDDVLPTINKGNMISLGFSLYEVEKKIGEGGFARIYCVQEQDDGFSTCALTDLGASNKFAIKVEEPAQKWEFYIVSELHKRLAKRNDHVDVRPSVMKFDSGYFFKNGSILLSHYQPNGTLLDLVNRSSRSNLETMLPHLEPVMVYMAIELLHLVENIHACNVIHGDIKPDNFLILTFPYLPESDDPQVVFGGSTRFVQLIDFGQAIDMSKYPAGTTFLTKVTTECFQCIEMKTNRPWTYQTDLFGLAGTIHVLLHGQYMKVYQEAGHWKTTASYNRAWNSTLWKELFYTLLNVPSCDHIPDLAPLRQKFEDYFVTKLLRKYNTLCPRYNQIVQATS
ncbi:mitotic checkpoint serine/threonine-protein kinase BUB1-like isoform X2 [Mya arenaria]|uniref:mitotic checkpoint serine/threonine-protein kinase BUB1-like isoform X2 n=1 Tax=Mya arenaria TaxID=6604 RepID=UPI0022E6A626|nr:mitotic checkpoint serine/threonine-protein kinase BUB1-like isoform X2 [Mya arenaria]